MKTKIEEIDGEEVEVYDDKLDPIILYVPHNTVAGDMTAHVMDDKMNIQSVTQHIDPGQLADYRIDGYEWEGENIQYIINPDYKGEI